MLQIYLLIDVFSWHSLSVATNEQSQHTSTDNNISKLDHDIRKKKCCSLCSVNRTGEKRFETTCFQICPSKAQNAKM